MAPDPLTRRRLLRTTLAVGAASAIAGCGDDDGGNGTNGGGSPTPTESPGDGEYAATVAVAPDGSPFSFVPAEVTITTGETVLWEFRSPTHNVSCNPEHSAAVELPDDAEPFATYEGSDRYQTVDEGETFEHTFETAGEYVYVCIPHQGQGMIGTVVVGE